jgi:fumarate reductase subunit C
VSVWWWLETWSYAGFVIRELTSVFVALFALVMLWDVLALAKGPEAYARFIARLSGPDFIALHVVGMVFVLFHSITWFNLAPKAAVVRLQGKRVPDRMIAGANYVAWFFLSALIAFFVLRG